MSTNETPQSAARRLTQNKTNQGFTPAGLHEYQHANGAPSHWRIRLNPPPGSDQKKVIFPMYFDGKNYVLKEPIFTGKKPLYRLPALVANALPVMIVEGEKDADALAKLGVQCTTSGGATSEAAADWVPLAGRECVLFYDNDAAGLRYAQQVTAILTALGCAVRWMDIAALGLAEKDGAFDWLALHPDATAADVWALAKIDPIAPAATKQLERKPTHTIELMRGDNVAIEPVRWLWPGWLACGKLHVIAGAPGTGKTMLAIALASVVTRGGTFPDGSRCLPGSIAMWSGEDAVSDTLAPRFMAAGANLSKVHFVGDAFDDQGRRGFDPALDMDLLLQELGSITDLRMVVLDPFVSAIAGDSHKNAEVRRGLQPVVELAEKIGAVVFGVTHFTKGTGGREPLERVTGSLAFGAVARIVFGVDRNKDAEGNEQRIFCRLKSNLGIDTGGFVYDIEQAEAKPGFPATRAKFGAAVEGAARDLFAPMDEGEDAAPALNEAKQFIRDALADGPKPSQELEKEALKGGVKKATLRRARVALGVICSKRKFNGVWEWRLPDTQLDQLEHANANLPTQEMMSNFAFDEQLRSEKDVLPEFAEGEL
jgi:putative DNA primase/helicase